ncbi:MAG: hypothetical protein WCF12_15630 [Propionicimonas sp.]
MAQVAGQHARTARFVQQAVRSGDLSALRLVGRIAVMDDLAATAWARALAPGRRWTGEVREAALDLVSTGRTDRLSSSERSRLRSRLRGMSAAAMAHASGGLGGWARYRVTGVPDLPRVGPSALDQAGVGIVPGAGWVTFVETVDLDQLEFDYDVILDADGNLGVLQRPRSDPRVARVLLDSYLLGDARLSTAAATELERRAHGL